MNLKKKLQRFLLASVLLSSISAQSGKRPFEAISSAEEEAPALPPLPWGDLAPKVCQFLDSQSFGRLCQVSKILYGGAQRYRDSLPKGQALIDHLKTLPTAKEAFTYLSTYAQHDLHATEHFLEAFYSYLDVPQEERLLLINEDKLVLRPFQSPEDFTRKMTSYGPYGMCLLASYFLNPQPKHLQKTLGVVSGDSFLRQPPATQAYAYLFFVPYGVQGEEFYSQAAVDMALYLSHLFADLQICAREARKAHHLRHASRLKALHQLHYPSDPALSNPLLNFRLFPLEHEYAHLLKNRVHNLAPLEAFETKLWEEYKKAREHRHEYPYGVLQWRLLAFLEKTQQEIASAYNQLAQDCVVKAKTLTDPAEKASHFKQVTTHLEKRLQKMGDAATAVDYGSCGAAYFNVASALTDPAEKAVYFKRAAIYYEKMFQKKGDAATAVDYGIGAKNYFSAAINLTDPAEKATYFKLAAPHYEKVLQKKGDTATAADYANCGNSYCNAALNLTDPAEKATYFKLAAPHYEKVLQKKGNAAQEATYSTMLAVYTRLAETSSIVDEKAAALARAEELRQMKAQKFPAPEKS